MALDFRKSYPIVEWDLNKRKCYVKYFGSLDDNSNGFKVQILQDGDVVIPSTEAVRFYCEKPDNTRVYIDAIIIDDYFVIDLSNQVFTVKGDVNCCFQISSNLKWKTSPEFVIHVNNNNVNGSIASTDEFIVLQDALNRIDNFEVTYAPRLTTVENNIGDMTKLSDTDLVSGINELKINNDNNIAFSNKRFKTTNYKITNDNKYSAWAQDKCFTLNNVLYLLYNSGTDHISSDLLPYMRKSYDGGLSWSSPIVMYNNPDPSTYVSGVTCWAAGTDGTRFFSVILLAGADNLVGNKKHVLVYGNPESDPSTWTHKDINISKGGYVPNEMHSLGCLSDGSIVVGYDYMSGETGVAKSPDWGNTWTTHPIFTDAQNGNDLNNCEITFCVDGNTVLGFLRSEGRNPLILPKFWKSTDGCNTFTVEDASDIPFATPIPIKRVGNKYYAYQSERTGECKAYLHEGNVTDVLANGYSSFTKTYLGNLYYDGTTVGSGAGVGSLVSLNSNLYIFYSNENPNKSVDMFLTIVELRQPDNAVLQFPTPVQKEQLVTDTLWTNPNPNASFTGQTIVLNSSNFTDLEFIYNTASTSGRQSVKIPKGFSTAISALTPSGTSIYISVRQATKITDTSYAISDALYGAIGGSFGVDNAVCVPISIIGYRKK